MPEKKLNCDAQVLKKLQKDNVEVQVVRNKKGIKVRVADNHITGCRVYQDPMNEKKKLYSVTTIDGKHHRGPMPKE